MPKTGVYIKGMEMPKDYSVIVKIFPDGRVGTIPYVQLFKVELIEGTKAVPVPPHGRLIDANALARFLLNKYWDSSWISSSVLDRFVSEIANAPTIIPAEEES